MKKKYLHIMFVLTSLILLSTCTLAASPSNYSSHGDGTEYTMYMFYDDPYKNGTLFEIEFKLTAHAFGSVVGVIEAFYDITIDISIAGGTFSLIDNITLSSIYTEGESSSKIESYNLTGLTEPTFSISTQWIFYGNNTQFADPQYGELWAVGNIGVKGANAAIITPIIAVLSLAYIIHKKQKR